MTDPVDVTDEEVKSIAQSILIRYGIDFTCYEPKSFRRRIIRMLSLHDLTSVHALWVKFLSDPTFIYTFMNGVSVGMTSMFRDPVLWRSLRGQLQNRYGHRDTISIWHAGCSTGEEVYSMGILLREAARTATALATDINQDAIETAKTGTYHKIRMVENENNYREYNPYGNFERYYRKAEKEMTMDPGLINHVSFHYHNLITDPIATTHDIILCRNVMIYFDHAAKAKLLAKFYDSLNPGGLFIVGFYDAPVQMVDEGRFDLIDPDAKIFVKK